MIAWLDGCQVQAPAQALWRGEAVYETLLWLDGPPPAFAHHVERMARGAQRLGVRAPTLDELAIAIRQAIGSELAQMRVRVTCMPNDAGAVSLLVEARPVTPQELQPPPATVVLGPLVRNPAAWFNGCKHVGIAADLALRRASGADEVLLRSVDGWLSEGATASVLFGLDDGRIATPGPQAAPLPGTTLAQLQSEGLTVVEVLFDETDLARIEWMLLLNAVCGARVVARLHRRQLSEPPADLLAWAKRCVGAVRALP